MHTGMASSHLRCRFLQVRQPVRTRLGLATAGDVADGPGFKDSLPRRFPVLSKPAEEGSPPLGKGWRVDPSIGRCPPGLAAFERTADLLGLLEMPASDTLWRLVGDISK